MFYSVYILEKFVQFEPDVHKDEFIQMNIEYISWIADQLSENFQIDAFSMISSSAEERAFSTFEEYRLLKPPNGIVYIFEVNGDIAGMIALRKLSDDVGEIKRMYNRPQFRGRGIGRKLLNQVLEWGRNNGCSIFRLDTANYKSAAQHIFRTSGFKEIGAYPGSAIGPILQPYWTYMEKRE